MVDWFFLWIDTAVRENLRKRRGRQGAGGAILKSFPCFVLWATFTLNREVTWSTAMSLFKVESI